MTTPPPERTRLERIARGWFDEVMNARDVDAIDRLYGDEYSYAGPDGSMPRGREMAKRIARYLIDAMPDRVTRVVDQLVDGDRVVTRWSSRGTPTQQLMGREPDGRPVTVHGITISRIANGRIVEDWEITRVVEEGPDGVRSPAGGSGESQR